MASAWGINRACILIRKGHLIAWLARNTLKKLLAPCQSLKLSGRLRIERLVILVLMRVCASSFVDSFSFMLDSLLPEPSGVISIVNLSGSMINSKDLSTTCSLMVV